MQFDSRLKRAAWFHTLLGLIPDVLVAAAFSAWFSVGIIGFAIFLIGIQILYGLIWLKNSLWSWLLFATFGRKQCAALLLDGFTARKFPEPEDYQQSVEGFFGVVAADEAQPIGIRLAAASELGALGYPVSQGHWQDALRISMAYEDALIAYKRSFAAHTSRGVLPNESN